MSGSIQDRFALRRDDLIVTPAETDEQRFAAFIRPFGALPEDGIIYDRSGHPLKITNLWTQGLDRYAAEELERAARTIADPDEIRTLWQRREQERLYTRRFLRKEDETGIAVDINRTGWCFATTEDPCFEFERLRVGELQWSRQDPP